MIFSHCPKHLYIHWPFCSIKCHYCDFVALQQHDNYQEAYHRFLLNEITTFCKHLPPEPNIIDTIFLGGGTPSLYPLPWITELFETLNTKFDLSNTKEITIETNPADIDEEKLDTWRELGINRMSMGVQCLDDAVLLDLGRRQRITDVLRAIKIAPKYFDNISVDLILGLPGVTTESWYNTINTVVQWPIKHISVYFLTIHEKTPLYFRVQKGTINLIDDGTMVDTYQQTVMLLERGGFEQYEISNFARHGFESVHNTAYWNRKPYKGFGLGASSFDGTRRAINDNNLERYLTPEASIVPYTEEILTDEQATLELLMLGLRQKKGLGLRDVLYLLSSDQETRFKENLALLVAEGFMTENNATIRITTKGMPLENEIIKRLL